MGVKRLLPAPDGTRFMNPYLRCILFDAERDHLCAIKAMIRINPNRLRHPPRDGSRFVLQTNLLTMIIVEEILFTFGVILFSDICHSFALLLYYIVRNRIINRSKPLRISFNMDII